VRLSLPSLTTLSTGVSLFQSVRGEGSKVFFSQEKTFVVLRSKKFRGSFFPLKARYFLTVPLLHFVQRLRQKNLPSKDGFVPFSSHSSFFRVPGGESR
jgi:hypothetical protein